MYSFCLIICFHIVFSWAELIPGCVSLLHANDKLFSLCQRWDSKSWRICKFRTAAQHSFSSSVPFPPAVLQVKCHGQRPSLWVHLRCSHHAAVPYRGAFVQCLISLSVVPCVGAWHKAPASYLAVRSGCSVAHTEVSAVSTTLLLIPLLLFSLQVNFKVCHRDSSVGLYSFCSVFFYPVPYHHYLGCTCPTVWGPHFKTLLLKEADI